MGKTIYKSVQTYNLMALLGHVHNLFSRLPPLTMEELFGAEAAPQRESEQAEAAPAQEEWDNFDPFEELLQAAQHGANRGVSDI